MHELFVTERIRDIAVEHALAAGGRRITDLFLVVGELSSIVDESVQFYWDFVSEGTVAEGARLHFRRVPAELACQACGHHYRPAEGLTCPRCDSNNVRIIAGEEFYLDAIDVTDVEEEMAESGSGSPPRPPGQLAEESTDN
jgi:hydrogenase nickel incorporation protein HypA/HybF